MVSDRRAMKRFRRIWSDDGTSEQPSPGAGVWHEKMFHRAPEASSGDSYHAATPALALVAAALRARAQEGEDAG